MMIASDALTALQTFRADLYACFTQRRDALFDLVDALLTADAVPSPVHLSLAPGPPPRLGQPVRRPRPRPPRCRRRCAPCWPASRWPTASPSTPSIAASGRAATPRPAPRAAIYYHPSRHSAGQPIVAGWAYQWVAQLSFARDSWTAPLDVAARATRPTTANAVAVEQIRALVAAPAGRRPRRRCSSSTPATTRCSCAEGWPTRAPPSWSGCAATAASTPTRPSQPRHRPAARRHGAKFVCADPATWPAPTRRARRRGRPVRAGARPRLERAARQSSRTTRRAAPEDRARSCAGRSSWSRSAGCRGRRAAQAAVAVVGGAGRARPGRAVARLRPPLRSGAHPALRQADAAVDGAPRAPSRAGRPLDLAGGRRLHPAAAGQARWSPTGGCPGSGPARRHR